MNHSAMSNAVFKIIRSCCQHLLQSYDRLNTANITKEKKFEFAKMIDQEIQAELISQIKEMYPRHKFVAEEPSKGISQELIDDDNVWIIDPIDGTNNYVHNIPFFAISICYYFKGKAKVAWVYDPFHDEFFSAISGKGALLNQHRIYGSSCKSMSDAIIALEVDPRQPINLPNGAHRTRKFGCTSLALCYAACGRVDMSLCELPNIWDIAAGLLIAQESTTICFNGHLKSYQLGDQYLYITNKYLYTLMK